jgi:hypothetical protein
MVFMIMKNLSLDYEIGMAPRGLSANSPHGPSITACL